MSIVTLPGRSPKPAVRAASVSSSDRPQPANKLVSDIQSVGRKIYVIEVLVSNIDAKNARALGDQLIEQVISARPRMTLKSKPAPEIIIRMGNVKTLTQDGVTAILNFNASIIEHSDHRLSEDFAVIFPTFSDLQPQFTEKAYETGDKFSVGITTANLGGYLGVRKPNGTGKTFDECIQGIEESRKKS